MTTAKSADMSTAEAGGRAGGTQSGTSPREVVGDVANGVKGAAETVVARLPEAAATTRAAVDEAARRIETGSDEMLTAGATLSLGLAIGLLIGGASRILVVLALIPAAAMGMTLLDRSSRNGGRARRQPLS
ncbi:MAG TPA: hypothetical protein VGQ58_07075 [Candidatus Limnocylindrales bacterium]|jgi:hypothetical protein|nr:hypothetical protein [Candidatus Limnocylindrales bacterium]